MNQDQNRSIKKHTTIPGLDKKICRLGMGTRAAGGSGWGGTDPEQALQALHAGFYRGVNAVHTSPRYGFGIAEEIVGSAIQQFDNKKREEFVISTGTGSVMNDGHKNKPLTGEQIRSNLEDSLERIRTDHIDLYLLDIPENQSSVNGFLAELKRLKKEHLLKAIGVICPTEEQLKNFEGEFVPDAVLAPFNLFEQQETEVYRSWCNERKTVFIGCGVLCRGLLTGRITAGTKFKRDDLRKEDPKFSEESIDTYLNAVDRLDRLAQNRYGRSVSQLAARYVLEQGADIALWGVRAPEQTEPFEGLFDWKMNPQDINEIENICSSIPVR